MAEQIVYVDPGVSGGLGDGSSRANAYASLRAATLAGGGDKGGDDVTTICFTSDGTKDTGGGSYPGLSITNAGTVTYKGENLLTQTYIDTTNYVMSNSDANEGFDVRTGCIVENMQFDGSPTQEAIEIASAGDNTTIRRCLLDASNLVANIVVFANGAQDCVFINNVIYEGAAYAMLVQSGPGWLVANNTIVGTYAVDGFWLHSGAGCTIKNNIIEGAATEDYDLDVGDEDTASNISEDTSSPDVAFREITLTYEDRAGGDFRLASTDTDAIDAGEDLSALFTDDFFGATRSGWSIGAHEYGSAAAAEETHGGALSGRLSRRAWLEELLKRRRHENRVAAL